MCVDCVQICKWVLHRVCVGVGVCRAEHLGALLCQHQVLDRSCAVCQMSLRVQGHRGSQEEGEKAHPEEAGQGLKYTKMGGKP